MNPTGQPLTTPPSATPPPPVEHNGVTAAQPSPDDGRRELRRLRRVARKTVQLADSDPTAREVVSHLYGTGNIADLAVEIVTTSSRTALAPLRALLQTDITDQVELGIELAEGGRDRMRTYWRLLRMIGAAARELPASDVKAAMLIARTVLDLTDRQRGQLAAAADLATRASG